MNLTLKILWSDATVKSQNLFLLNSLSRSVQEIFSQASDGAIKLSVECIEQPHFSAPSSFLTLSALVKMGNKHVKNTQTKKEETHSTEILAVIGTRFWSEPPDNPWFGLMYDTNIKAGGIQYSRGTNNRPRECCCVFTEPLKDFSLEHNLRRDKLVTRTLVHEIGHIFNLQHPADNSVKSFMSNTTTEIVGVDGRAAFESFLPSDEKKLKLIDNDGYEKHRPGTDEFG